MSEAAVRRWTPPAAVVGWPLTLAQLGLTVSRLERFGPMGEHAVMEHDGSRGSIIVTQAEHDGDEWLHASIAFADRDPTYAELAALHRAVFGRRRFAYQVFAPAADHVNIHEHALHLWGHVDGRRLTPAALNGSI